MKLKFVFSSPQCGVESTTTSINDQSVATFLAHDGVCGDLYLDSCEETIGLVDAMVDIRLTGHVKNSLNWEEQSIGLARTKGLVYERKVLDITQRHSVMVPAEPESRWLCRFRVDLDPDMVLDDNFYLNQQQSTHFPSSLEQSQLVPNRKHSHVRAVASVQFHLHARLRLAGSLLAWRVQKVCLFDCSEVAPPLVAEDFGPEYVLAKSGCLRSNVFQKLGTMNVGAIQPPALVFSGIGGPAATKVNLHVKLHLKQGYLTDLRTLSLDAAIRWRLQSSTFVCMRMLTAMPTSHEVSKSPSMARIAKCWSEHSLKMKWSDWERTPLSTTGQVELTATFPVWLSVDASSLLPPTFSLPYLSRRYSIVLTVHLQGSCRAEVQLQLPVQVAYRTNGSARHSWCHPSRRTLVNDNLTDAFVSSDALPEDLPPYIR